MESFHSCQCCLSPDCTKDIFTEYYYKGEREVYSEMLLNTLNISVVQDISSKICENCINTLRTATDFKKTVLSSRSYLETNNDMRKSVEQYCSDFEDKLSVNFEDEASLDSCCKNGKIFVIKLMPTNLDDTQIPHDDNIADVEDNSSKQMARDLRKCKNIKDFHEKTTKPKPKKPDSKNHKELKENSLNLVFNSNLCLFKSLKTKFGCFNCTEAFLTIKELREHTKIHSNVELIRVKFNRLRGLSYQNADISSLKCTRCEQACLDLIELQKHLVEKHGVEFGSAGNFLIPYKLQNSFDCVVCNEKFNTYMRLSMHMNQHFSNNVCEICGSSYINRISLRIHLQSRHREKKCSLCSETFISNYARVRHMRTHHNSCLSKRYCLICGKTFRYTYQLIKHKVSEHGVKRQLSKCTLCPKTFPNTQNLRIHVRSVHIKERNFPCTLCDMRFFTKFDQKRHEKTHVDVRSFACCYCESKFKGKDSLRRHLKRQHGHTGT